MKLGISFDISGYPDDVMEDQEWIKREQIVTNWA